MRTRTLLFGAAIAVIGAAALYHNDLIGGARLLPGGAGAAPAPAGPPAAPPTMPVPVARITKKSIPIYLD